MFRLKFDPLDVFSWALYLEWGLVSEYYASMILRSIRCERTRECIACLADLQSGMQPNCLSGFRCGIDCNQLELRSVQSSTCEDPVKAAHFFLSRAAGQNLPAVRAGTAHPSALRPHRACAVPACRVTGVMRVLSNYFGLQALAVNTAFTC